MPNLHTRLLYPECPRCQVIGNEGIFLALQSLLFFRTMYYAAPLMEMVVDIDTNTECSDETLMLRYRGGDADAFELLYRRHKDPLYRYMLRQCGNHAVAEELFQDVWLNIIRTHTRYTVGARFQTFLYHVAHNRLIDHYRRSKNGALPVSYDENAPVMDATDNDGSHQQPERIIDGQRQLQQLAELIDELPEAQREAFLLREESGLDLEEIAAITCVNTETAKSRLRYAMVKLRKGLNI